MLLSINVVIYNNEELIDQFINNIKETLLDRFDAEIIFIDNDSSDKSVNIIEMYLSSRIKLIKNTENKGYASAINTGVAASNGVILIICNPDILINKFDEKSLEIIHQDFTGVLWVNIVENNLEITHTQRFPSNIDHVLNYLPLIGKLWRQYNKIKVKENEYFYGWGMGSFCLVSRTAYDTVGGWDESYFLFKEETDFAKMLCDNGRLSRYTELISITHFGGQSTKKIGDKLKVYREMSNIHYFKKHFRSKKIFLLFALIYSIIALIINRKVYIDIYKLHAKAWREK